VAASMSSIDNIVIVPARNRQANTLVERTLTNDEGRLLNTDHACCAFTDFHFEYPITVSSETTSRSCARHMRRLGIHALLVTRRERSSIDEQVIGLVTHNDISLPGRSRNARLMSQEPARVRVGALMTPWDKLSLVHYESLASLTALEMLQMFQGTGLTHLLVINMQDDGPALARGIISRGALAGRLAMRFA
jgi:CBS-domain-containing membrane protein